MNCSVRRTQPIVDRDRRLDVVGAVGELRRPAADVDHEERPAGAVEAGGRAGEGQPAPPRRPTAARAARRPRPRPGSKNSSRFDASRAAEVAVMRTAPARHAESVHHLPVLVEHRDGAVDRLAARARRRWSTPWPSRVMRMSRSTGTSSRLRRRARRRRAAGWSWCRCRWRRHAARHRCFGQAGRDPAAHGVVAAGEEPGVVGVQALHAPAGAADAARRAGARGGPRDRGVALGGVASVRLGDAVEADGRLGRRHPARRSRAGRPPPARPHRPASSGWASACRRAAAARCGRPPGRRRGRGRPPRTRRGAAGRGARSTASTSSSGVAVGAMAAKRTIAGVQPVTRWPRWLLAAAVAVLLLAFPRGRRRRGAGDHRAVAPAPARRAADIVFVGRVTTIVDDVVTFAVSEVRSGDVGRQDDRRPVPDAVQRPRAGGRPTTTWCRWSTPPAPPRSGTPRSFVDTAEIDACGSRGTRHADGSPIDTGAFAGVGRHARHVRGLDRRRGGRRAPRPAGRPRPLPRPPFPLPPIRPALVALPLASAHAACSRRRCRGGATGWRWSPASSPTAVRRWT